MTKGYQPTIGLEIHAELNTATKMFCGCANPIAQPGGGLELKPNSLVCPVCLGLPGALPFANEQAIAKTYLIARALGCQMADHTHWERKNYFYPDLPKGFQISQYAAPIGVGGKLAQVTVRRVHLEEDTGKLLHPKDADYSLVDFNRSGVPLVELVTETEIASAKKAVLLAKEYQLVLRYLDVSGADMEKGQFRVEVNISLNMGTKVEIKNLNSFRTVERAIEYELKRQTALIEAGEPVAQETRGWHEAKQQTVSQRVKETESDYRYFPEPDLPPILNSSKFKAQSSKLPELPQHQRAKLKKLGLSDHYIEVFVGDLGLLDKFEGTLRATTAKDNSLVNRLARILVNAPDVRRKSNLEIVALAKLPEHKLKLALSGKLDQAPEIPPEKLDETVRHLLKEHTKAVADYRAGKQAALEFLLGQVKRQVPHVDPVQIRAVLLKALNQK